MQLEGVNAVVTGAASGLGLAAARRLAAEGARVILSDRVADGARAAARAIDPSGSRVQAQACDVTDPGQTEALVAAAERFFDAPVDVFLANAGIGFTGPFLETSPQALRRVMDVNVMGAMFSAQAALRSLTRSEKASLIFTASLQSVTGRAMRSAYTASKHAVAGLVKSLALEFGPLGVRVNAVAPGAIDTELLRTNLRHTNGAGREEEGLEALRLSLPLRRMATLEDFANTALFLASPFAPAITGQVLVIDAGASAGFSPPVAQRAP